jgi:hypothetical protein
MRACLAQSCGGRKATASLLCVHLDRSWVKPRTNCLVTHVPPCMHRSPFQRMCQDEGVAVPEHYTTGACGGKAPRIPNFITRQTASSCGRFTALPAQCSPALSAVPCQQRKRTCVLLTAQRTPSRTASVSD